MAVTIIYWIVFHCWGVCQLNYFLIICLSLFPLLCSGCEEQAWNDPYPYENQEANTLYSAFSERPKHLDPARSYTAAEWPIIGQIYEPPYQYHYLKRPYVLEPLTATEMPEIHYFDANGKEINGNEKNKNETIHDQDQTAIAFTDYIIKIKPGILYEPHPAFAKDQSGNYLYHHLNNQEIKKYHKLSDFKETGTRELVAEDYIYQIKRLAEPNLSSPIFGLLSEYILGLTELRKTLNQADANTNGPKLERDLRTYELMGATVIDKYTYKIRIKGKYPQFIFWLALPFFSPVPWEVSRFYAQPGLDAHNISLDWYPVGTGPYSLKENNPNRRMTMVKNPNFRGEFFPSEGSEQDKAIGLLADAGKPIPFIDKIIFTLEKEDIPYWDKFLQGYYDMSGIQSDNFNSAVRFGTAGQPEITPALKEKGIRLQTSFQPSVFFWGFNMLDETVGGYTEKAKNLRKAISMAMDIEEFILIFMNGRAEKANGPLPPDIFGYAAQKKRESSLEEARLLLKKAGVPEDLTIYMDAIVSGDPDEISIQAWLKEQFNKLGIHIVIRGSDYNRFQDKVRNGTAAMFFSGWNADYPDPENFLFLFYSPNGSAEFKGENLANYKNPEYDVLFEKMRLLPDGPERLAVIGKMIEILNEDKPWVWGFFPKSFALYHDWMRVGKPSTIVHNNFKYAKVEPKLRAVQRKEWNHPIIWPLIGLCVFLGFIAAIFYYRIRQTAQEKALRIG